MAKAKKPAAKGGKGWKKPATLTAQEMEFCKQYALTHNGAESYAKSYPASLKHTPQYRAEKASKMLAKAKIKDQISILEKVTAAVIAEEFSIEARAIIQEIAAVAFANPGDYYTWGTQERPVFDRKTGMPKIDPRTGDVLLESRPYVIIKSSEELSRTQLKAIAGAEQTESKAGTPLISVKMADKLAALKLLGSHVGLFKTVAQIEGKGGGPVQVVLTASESAL